MDYDAIDRDMSSWVVTCIKNGTRFWIADNEAETATDIWSRARRYRYFDLAESAMNTANAEMLGDWVTMSVPEAVAGLRSVHQQARVVGETGGD